MAYSAASQKKYNDEKCTFITLKLHKEKDKELLDIINALVEQGLSKQAAVKQLILKSNRPSE